MIIIKISPTIDCQVKTVNSFQQFTIWFNMIDFSNVLLKGFIISFCTKFSYNFFSVSVKLNVEDEDKPKLSGAGLLGNFTLSNIHFHWPSEHTINGK